MVRAPARGFATAEFVNRCKAAQQAMASRDIAALLLTSEADVRYFTGFMTQFWQSPTRPWFVLLPASGRPIAVIPSIGVPLMRDCYVGDLRSWVSPAETDDGISLLADLVHDHVGNSDRLGMMMGRETTIRMPLADIEALQAQLNGIKLADMTADIQQIRMIKSPAEQEKLKYICSTVSRVFATIPSWVVAGMPLDELFRQFKIKALEAGVDDVSYLVGSAGLGGYKNVIAPPSSRPLARGDVFMLDTGCVWDGHFSDFDRNFAIHHATDAAKEAHHRLFDATEAALDILKPGIAANDLFSVMDHVLRPNHLDQMGGDEVGRYGHGLGIQLTEPPSHTNWDKTVMRAGMAITIEPSINYGDGLTMVAEENLLISDDGIVLLSERAPRDLPIVFAP
ncbi:Xaa-Pro peptidase family protein [Candidatus Puniceispirillum sp.]|nr:Xaa-Pro peptidase family protein [Candidatus Puniceispirillum sp.]